MLTELKAKEQVFQLERGAETGKLHWQGFMNLKMKNKLRVVAQQLNEVFNGIEIQPAYNADALKKYCTKPETRVKGPFTEGKNSSKRHIKVVIEKMLPWQEKILSIPRNLNQEKLFGYLIHQVQQVNQFFLNIQYRNMAR